MTGSPGNQLPLVSVCGSVCLHRDGALVTRQVPPAAPPEASGTAAPWSPGHHPLHHGDHRGQRDQTVTTAASYHLRGRKLSSESRRNVTDCILHLLHLRIIYFNL